MDTISKRLYGIRILGTLSQPKTHEGRIKDGREDAEGKTPK